MNIIFAYYLFIFLFVGVLSSIVIALEWDDLFEHKFVLIFMYQYAIYALTKDRLNIVGIIILEILATASVWFLNVIIFICVCFYYIVWAICRLFYLFFKKR